MGQVILRLVPVLLVLCSCPETLSGGPDAGSDAGAEPYCGDGRVDYGPEACDDGVNDGSYGGCEPGCKKRGPHCGDGVVNGNEACDGEDLAGTTCESLGHGAGYLSCEPLTCQFDESRCGTGWIWERYFTADRIRPYDVAVDDAGYVYVVGVFEGTLDAGGAALESETTDGRSESTLFLVKLAPDGHSVWSRMPCFKAGPSWLSLEPGETVLVGGVCTLEHVTHPDPWQVLTRVDSHGETVATQGGVRLYDLEVDDRGYVYMVSQGTVQPVPLMTHNAISVFSPDLQPVWYRQVLWAQPGAVLPMPDGGAVGAFFGSVFDLGDGPIDVSGETNKGGIFLVRFDGAGEVRWLRTYVHAGPEHSMAEPTDLALAANGDIVMTGMFSDSISFGGETFTSNAVSAFLAEFTPEGEHVRSLEIDAYGGRAEPSRVRVRDGGGVVVAGVTNSSLNVEGEVLLGQGTFLLVFDADWRLRWHLLPTGNGASVAVHGEDIVLLSGCGDITDFGGPPPPVPEREGGICVVKLRP